MDGFVSYRRFGRARSLRSDRTERMLDIDSIVTDFDPNSMYPFELGVVPVDIILKGSSFVRGSQVFPLGVDIDGTTKIVSPSLFCWVIEPCLMDGPCRGCWGQNRSRRNQCLKVPGKLTLDRSLKIRHSRKTVNQVKDSFSRIRTEERREENQSG
ncbi:hypothetical protein DY000_02021085 [Brassica cretica]|uniref:Uncharacterized protein n=2 Tax=Brassica cretica TaxID=69181 RepID=A0ABQ7EG61_BRACR|nr:hypothetical protein DY000_02021085 [Brassica cretica]